MANNIGLTALAEGNLQADQLIIKMKEVLALANQSLANNKNNVSSPAGFNNQQGGNAALTASIKAQSNAISELQQKYNSLLQTQARASAGARGNASATRENTIANQILRAETDRNFRANTLLAGAYAKASTQLLILKKQAKDYAISLGETHPKTLQAIKDANDLSGRINAADNAVGDFQRNVGNYSNGITKGLSGAFSVVRQLAYLLPGIGIAGILGFATEPIIEYISKLDLFSKKLNAAKEAQKAFGDIAKESAKTIIEERTNLEVNLAVAKDTTLSYEKRLIAVKNLQDEYPFYFKNLTTEKILAGETKVAYEELTLAILSRAKANAASAKITETQSKIIDLEQTQLDLTRDLTDAKIRQSDATAKANKADLQRGESNAAGAVYSIAKVDEIQRKIAKNQKEINELNAYNNRLTAYAIENQKKAIGLDYNPEKEKAKKEAKREDIKSVNELKVATDSYLIALREQLAIFTKLREVVPKTSEEYKAITEIMKGFQASINAIEDPAKNFNVNGLPNYFKGANAEVKKLDDSVKKFLGTFENSFLADAGLPALDMFLRLEDNGKTVFQNLIDKAKETGDEWRVMFEGVTQVAQEAFNFINDASQANFDAEYSRLEKQKNVALKFAGESTTAQQAITDQYEERKRDIANREAAAKKRLAVFNILIDTAQAVVAALPNIPLSIAIGVIGAVQAGIVASQEVPRFFEGGTHKGGLMLVNDAKGNDYRETIRTPDGNIIQPNGRNVLMNAPAGTEIFTPEQWAQEQMMNDLAKQGIFPSAFSRYFNNNSISGLSKDDFNAGIGRLMKTIDNKTEITEVRDNKGYRQYQKRNGIKQQTIGRYFNQTGEKRGK